MEQAIVIKVLAWAVGVLASALGFFLSYYFTRTSKALDRLGDAITEMRLSFTGLNCAKKHEVVDERLKDHGRQLDRHEGKLIELDTKVNLNR